MNHCMRCHQPCSASAILCDQCRLQLQGRSPQEEPGTAGEGSKVSHSIPSFEPTALKHNEGSTVPTPLVNSPSISAQVEESFYLEPAYDEQDEHRAHNRGPVLPAEPFVPDAGIVSDNTSPLSFSATVPMDAFYPEPDIETSDKDRQPFANDYQAIVDHSFHMLNDAARMIAELEGDAAPGSRLRRRSRLSPLRDISADIRRESTPLPSTAYSTEHMQKALDKRLPEEDLDKRLPDLWPWLHSAEIDEEKDEWIDHDDPLISRRFPTSTDKTSIGSNNLLIVLSARAAVFWQSIWRAPRKWLRLSFIAMCAIAIVALAVDVVLVTFLEHGGVARSSLPPTMMLSTRFANQGDLVTIHLKDFAPGSSIALSHDIQEHIKLIHEGDIIHAGPQGSKDVVMQVENDWEAGSHTIAAEDIRTHYTASVVLSVGVGPARPAHLQLESTDLDLGTSLEGSNTLRTVRLDNTGGGIIDWAASSNTSWLMFTPNHGMFSDRQDVQIAVDRTKLKPGSYTGKITFSSNVSEPQDIMVHMSVMAIPADAGAVLDVSPPVMSFTAVDGMADPIAQTLVISNPGKQPLHWSLHTQSPNTKADSNSYISNLVGVTNPWLTASTTADTLPPGENISVNIDVHSRTLLPGTYTVMMQFQDPLALNSPQEVAVSLTVQPRCSLLLSTGNLLFTTVAGQNGTNSQVLNLVGNASCGGNTNWVASSSVPWLTITPSKGDLMNAATASTTVTANTSGMAAGTYNGVVTITMAQSTQTVSVQLIIQPPPRPSAPILGASPLNLNFSVTSGQANPPGQSIAIANTGGSPLTLAVTPTPLAKWLSVVPGPGIISAGQTGSLMVDVDATGLTPGSYSGQIALSGVNADGNPASGSPQTIGITFTVFNPCTLTFPSATSLVFNAAQGGLDPASQQVTFTASGNCSWPLNWRINQDASASWLKLSPANGQFTTSGQSATVVINPGNAGLLAGDYYTSVNLVATDSTGASVPGSPQKLSVTLSIQQPCTFQSSSPGLTFSAIQGQTASQQSIPLRLSGSCVLPVSWTAAVDSRWIQLSTTTGSDNGQGSTLGVSVDATGLSVGNYRGIVTITPGGSGGASVDGRPQIPIMLTVTGTTVSITVDSCATVDCLSPVPLPGALVSLSDSTGRIVASQTTDANGVATFTNMPVGNYTAVANGTDIGQVVYSGSGPVSVVGNVVTMHLNVIASSPTPSP